MSISTQLVISLVGMLSRYLAGGLRVVHLTGEFSIISSSFCECFVYFKDEKESFIAIGLLLTLGILAGATVVCIIILSLE